MDKRYLLILIIIILCFVNLSIIVSNSDTVGSASTSVGKYMFSLPNGFSLYGTTPNSTVIKNDNGMNIHLESNLIDSDTYNKQLNYLENETNNTILSEGTVKIENISVNTVYFENTNHTNKSVFYFEKNNVPFKIIISNFNYNNERNLTLDYITLIIQSMHFDYKTK